MWELTIRSPSGEPTEYVLKPGRTSIGRKSDNDIAIDDESASRLHAEFLYDAQAGVATIRDLASTNGTFVNRERLTAPHLLSDKDSVRIGEYVITVSHRPTAPAPAPRSATRPLTRDMVLESLDHHAVLLYEAASRLNTIIDLDTALTEVARLMRVFMAADKCEVILADQFDRLHELGFPTSIAQQAIDQRSAVSIPQYDARSELTTGQSALLLRVRSVLCVPVMIGEEIAALIYVYKTNPASRPIGDTDVQLAVAVSHQAALTIQRTRLLRRVRHSDRISHLFQRFLSPPEAEYLLQAYLHSGQLPGLTEQVLTVMFTDMRDSTGLAERLGARRFGEILSRYYQDMTLIVFEHQGLLNKYLGDGLMAVFGAMGRPDPEARAVEAAVAMLKQIEAINADAEEAIEIGIGINTGSVVAGYVGTEERVEYTVLGDIVNVAQRMQELARPNRIFVGPETCEAVLHHFETRFVGPVEIRGRTQPVEAFEVVVARG